MFHDALLESSSFASRRKSWPMATAFTLELIVASVLVMMPLLSSGIISLSTRVSLPVPPSVTPLENHQPAVHSGSPRGGVVPRPEVVVPMENHTPLLVDRWSKTIANTPGPRPDIGIGGRGNDSALPDLGIKGDVIQPPPLKRIIISRSIEAYLVNKVVPEYPTIARLAGIHGDVKLHAIIATDGTIQSLAAISGHPTLIPAAVKAVQQWRYRPYILDGQAVEVETFITVSFKRTN